MAAIESKSMDTPDETRAPDKTSSRRRGMDGPRVDRLPVTLRG